MEKSRLGTFFLLIGLVMLILFFGTDQSQNPQYILFFGGTPLTVLGVYLLWSDRKPTEPTTRFSGVRRLMSRRTDPPKGKLPPKKDDKKGFFRIPKK